MPDNELVDFTEDIHWIYGFCAFCCVVCAALAAGLTVGLLSMDSIKLQIKLVVGTDEEKRAAEKILPVISNHHLLLCTLLLFNALANEALPIFLDAILPSWAAVLLSVTLVLLCGEIIPSALFTGPSQLLIASKFIKLVHFLEMFFYPIAYPMAKVLDKFLGHEEEDTFNRDEISALVKILRDKSTSPSSPNHSSHGDDSSARSPLTNTDITALQESDSSQLTDNEVNVITGVLGLTKIRVKDICVPIASVNMLSIDQVLDQSTIDTIDQVGHSRLPVFAGNRESNHILGYLMVKRLIKVNPERAVPLRSLALNSPVVVGAEQSLLDVLNIFQSSHSHIALVSYAPRELEEAMKTDMAPSRHCAPIGILTIEDVFENMIQAQIFDEDDRDKSNVHKSASEALRAMSYRISSPDAASVGYAMMEESLNQAAISAALVVPSSPPLTLNNNHNNNNNNNISNNNKSNSRIEKDIVSNESESDSKSALQRMFPFRKKRPQRSDHGYDMVPLSESSHGLLKLSQTDKYDSEDHNSEHDNNQLSDIGNNRTRRSKPRPNKLNSTSGGLDNSRHSDSVAVSFLETKGLTASMVANYVKNRNGINSSGHSSHGK